MLAHCSSLQEAADRLHITKSALSTAISQLEDELGVRIFERTSRGTVLSEEGLRILSDISGVLKARNSLLHTAEGIRSSREQQTVIDQNFMALVRHIIPDDQIDLYHDDLVTFEESYLHDGGMSDEEIEQLKNMIME